MIEERLDEVFLADHVPKELLWAFDQPERQNTVEIAAESWVQVAHFLLQVWVRLLVEADQFIEQEVHALFLFLHLAHKLALFLQVLLDR